MLLSPPVLVLVYRLHTDSNTGVCTCYSVLLSWSWSTDFIPTQHRCLHRCWSTDTCYSVLLSWSWSTTDFIPTQPTPQVFARATQSSCPGPGLLPTSRATQSSCPGPGLPTSYRLQHRCLHVLLSPPVLVLVYRLHTDSNTGVARATQSSCPGPGLPTSYRLKHRCLHVLLSPPVLVLVYRLHTDSNTGVCTCYSVLLSWSWSTDFIPTPQTQVLHVLLSPPVLVLVYRLHTDSNTGVCTCYSVLLSWSWSTDFIPTPTQVYETYCQKPFKPSIVLNQGVCTCYSVLLSWSWSTDFIPTPTQVFARATQSSCPGPGLPTSYRLQHRCLHVLLSPPVLVLVYRLHTDSNTGVCTCYSVLLSWSWSTDFIPTPTQVFARATQSSCPGPGLPTSYRLQHRCLHVLLSPPVLVLVYRLHTDSNTGVCTCYSVLLSWSWSTDFIPTPTQVFARATQSSCPGPGLPTSYRLQHRCLHVLLSPPVLVLVYRLHTDSNTGVCTCYSVLLSWSWSTDFIPTPTQVFARATQSSCPGPGLPTSYRLQHRCLHVLLSPPVLVLVYRLHTDSIQVLHVLLSPPVLVLVYRLHTDSIQVLHVLLSPPVLVLVYRLHTDSIQVLHVLLSPPVLVLVYRLHTDSIQVLHVLLSPPVLVLVYRLHTDSIQVYETYCQKPRSSSRPPQDPQGVHGDDSHGTPEVPSSSHRPEVPSSSHSFANFGSPRLCLKESHYSGLFVRPPRPDWSYHNLSPTSTGSSRTSLRLQSQSETRVPSSSHGPGNPEFKSHCHQRQDLQFSVLKECLRA